MGFTDLLSRLSSGKTLPTSYYDEEFVVASIDEIQTILFNRTHFNSVDVNTADRPSVTVNTNTLVNRNIPSGVENASDVIGQNLPNNSLANFKLRIIVAIISCIAGSMKICDNSLNRTENCTSKCTPFDNSKFSFKSNTFSDKVLLHFHLKIEQFLHLKRKSDVTNMEKITGPSLILPKEHNIALKIKDDLLPC